MEADVVATRTAVARQSERSGDRWPERRFEGSHARRDGFVPRQVQGDEARRWNSEGGEGFDEGGRRIGSMQALVLSAGVVAVAARLGRGIDVFRDRSQAEA